MIDVRMAKHDCIQAARIKRELAIALHRFLAAALKKTALKQDLLAIDFQKVHGAGSRPGRAEEMNSHRRERRGWAGQIKTETSAAALSLALAILPVPPPWLFGNRKFVEPEE